MLFMFYAGVGSVPSVCPGLWFGLAWKEKDGRLCLYKLRCSYADISEIQTDAVTTCADLGGPRCSWVRSFDLPKGCQTGLELAESPHKKPHRPLHSRALVVAMTIECCRHTARS